MGLRIDFIRKGPHMRFVGLAAAFTLITTVVALGDDVPFAMPSRSDLVSLGDIMLLTQVRHTKLWYAGGSKDWEMANYELDRITEGLSGAALLYVNIPVDSIRAIGDPIADLRDAVATKNAQKFARGYSALTTACNSCHMAGNVGFIQLQIPTSPFLTDEKYAK
jgi:hypothetical protein